MSELGAQLDISVTNDGWALNGEIDAHTAPTLERALAELPSTVATVDVAGVTFMDSSGLRVLMAATLHARESGGDLIIANPTPGIVRLVEISGLSEHLRLEN
jgi:anti-anti-sigma factor